jgi:hypothetical protein
MCTHMGVRARVRATHSHTPYMCTCTDGCTQAHTYIYARTPCLRTHLPHTQTHLPPHTVPFHSGSGIDAPMWRVKTDCCVFRYCGRGIRSRNIRSEWGSQLGEEVKCSGLCTKGTKQFVKRLQKSTRMRPCPGHAMHVYIILSWQWKGKESSGRGEETVEAILTFHCIDVLSHTCDALVAAGWL